MRPERQRNAKLPARFRNEENQNVPKKSTQKRKSKNTTNVAKKRCIEEAGPSTSGVVQPPAVEMVIIYLCTVKC